MSSYALMLEMRKKNVGFLMHLIHFFLTMFTIVWVVVWIVHCWMVRSHNRKLDAQIDRLIIAEASDAHKS